MSRVRHTLAALMVLGASITPAVYATQPSPGHDPVQNNGLTIALTNDKIDVDAGFSGAQVTLFGVTREATAPSHPDQDNTANLDQINIIATITGPKRDVRSRPIVRTGLIWTASSATIIKDVPGLYYVLSSAPLNQFVDEASMIDWSLDLEHLNFTMITPDNDMSAARDGHTNDAKNEPEDTHSVALNKETLGKTGQNKKGHNPVGLNRAGAMTTALIENRTARGLFRHHAGNIRRLDNGLFSVTLDLPAQTPVGDYLVSVSAWRDGVAIASDQAALSVRKAGLERQIYDFARHHGFAYGVICVLISLFAGWAVSLVFRRG